MQPYQIIDKLRYLVKAEDLNFCKIEFEDLDAAEKDRSDDAFREYLINYAN